MDESLTPPMPMPAGGRLSEPRLKVLRELLGHRATGRTADELAAALEVSRNAVQQQLTALEGDGLVEVLKLRSTGGRPSRAYTLTEAGMELFPRHYAQLAGSLLRHVRSTFGEEGLERLLSRMASELGEAVRPRLEGKEGEARLREVVAILDELGYGAFLDAHGRVNAVNCVFHQLARTTDAVCRYDTAVLRTLLGSDLDHLACMRDGRPACVFSPR